MSKTTTNSRDFHRQMVIMSQLNWKNEIQTNTYALQIITYPAGIISWPLEQIQATDVKSRKLLTIHGGFQPKSRIFSFYTNLKECPFLQCRLWKLKT